MPCCSTNDAAYCDVVLACRIGGTAYCPLNWHFTAEEAGSSSCGQRRQGDPRRSGPAGADPGCPAARHRRGSRWATPMKAGSPRKRPMAAPRPPRAGIWAIPPARRGAPRASGGTPSRPNAAPRSAPPWRRSSPRPSARRRDAGPWSRRRSITAHRASSCRTPWPKARSWSSSPASMPRGLALIERHRIGWPTWAHHVVRLLRLPRRCGIATDVASLRFVASTGAPARPSEAVMIAWLGPVIPRHSLDGNRHGPRRHQCRRLAQARTAGSPVGGATIRILDEGTGAAAGRDRPRLCPQPAIPTYSYHGRGAADRRPSSATAISAGDLAMSDARVSVPLRQASDWSSRRRQHLSPEIELALLRLPGVLDCACSGCRMPSMARPHAVVQPVPGHACRPRWLAEGSGAWIAGYNGARSIEVLADRRATQWHDRQAPAAGALLGRPAAGNLIPSPAETCRRQGEGYMREGLAGGCGETRTHAGSRKGWRHEDARLCRRLSWQGKGICAQGCVAAAAKPRTHPGQRKGGRMTQRRNQRECSPAAIALARPAPQPPPPSGPRTVADRILASSCPMPRRPTDQLGAFIADRLSPRARPDRRRREPAGGKHDHRHPGGGPGGRRRLHAADGLGREHGAEPDALPAAALRSGSRPQPARRRGRDAAAHGRAAVAAGADPAGVRRPGAQSDINVATEGVGQPDPPVGRALPLRRRQRMQNVSSRAARGGTR